MNATDISNDSGKTPLNRLGLLTREQVRGPEMLNICLQTELKLQQQQILPETIQIGKRRYYRETELKEALSRFRDPETKTIPSLREVRRKARLREQRRIRGHAAGT